MATETKTAYLSPANGTLELVAARSAQPTGSIILDLGIPKFTVFSIKFPIPSGGPLAFQQVASEALGVMLDEMTAFMISLNYKKEVIAKVYALVLQCYKDMVEDDDPSKRERDPAIGTVRGEFPLPKEFINETQRFVVTAAYKLDKEVVEALSWIRKFGFPETDEGNYWYHFDFPNFKVTITESTMTGRHCAWYVEGPHRHRKGYGLEYLLRFLSFQPELKEARKVLNDYYWRPRVPVKNLTAGKEVKRLPKQRRMEFTPARPITPSKNDVLKAIRKYRFQTMKNQPFPLYLVVYDNLGNPKGTLSLGPGFHNDLLKMQYKKKGSDGKTEKVRKIVEAGGGQYVGIGENGKGGEIVYFNNPANRSTLVLDIDENLTPEAVTRKIEWSKALFEKRAGQWGLRSYDSDTVHDILDRHRPGYDDVEGTREHLGFDEPVPPENLPAILAEIDGLSNTPDDMQNFVGVVVFLVEHGSDVPEEYRLRAAALGEELLGNTEEGNPGEESERGWKLWKDPEGRKRQLQGEVALLSGKQTAVAKQGRLLREDEMTAWGQGKQDEYYAQHPELGSPGKKLNLMVSGPGLSTPVPLAKAVKADYTNEQGYWAGEGNAASGILPICTTTGRICFAWRSPYVNEGRCWGTIGGAVKEGMQPAESAEEELQEETGYSGGMTLHPAYVFADRGFRYFNFIGEVGREFGFHPMSDSAWETEALEWMGLDEALAYMKSSPGDFHHGVVALFKNSGQLIRQVCEKARKGKVDGKQSVAGAA
jgi:8-oxo-dGTP pyrophosphatase MutT (NUDIX family)